MRSIRSTATDDEASVLDLRYGIIAYVHTTYVRSHRASVAFGVHLFIIKIIISRIIPSEFRIVFVGCQHQGRAALAPSSHELCRNQLLLLFSVTHGFEIVAKRTHMLAHFTVCHKASISG